MFSVPISVDLCHLGKREPELAFGVFMGRTDMPDTFQSYTDAKTRRVCRSSELRDNAILKLALESLGAVKAAQDARWPCRVCPTQKISSQSELSLRRDFST